MSGKPLKHGDKKALEAKMARKSRRTETIPILPPNTVIFCEGTKTEPNYLRELVGCITKRYRKYAMENRISLTDVVKVEGTARSGKSLLEYAKKHLPVGVAQVWLVYDKDDFPSEQFNATPDMADAETKNGKTKYFAAWSNECIELWFLLHFQDMESNVSRDVYTEKLKKHYPEYTKTSADVYTRLKSRTGDAIKRAKRLREIYGDGKTPAEMAPCTTVYTLVEFLYKYLS